MPNLELPYMKEVTNNMWKTIKHLEEKEYVSIGCIPCKTIETYSELDKLKKDFELQFDNCTMVCPKCFVDAIIPITEDSKLWNLNDRERLELLKDWKTQGFE